METLTREQMNRLKELGLKIEKASFCNYHLYLSYNFGRDESEDEMVDLSDEFGEPNNHMGIPDNDGMDYSETSNIEPTFGLQDILKILSSSAYECDGRREVYLAYNYEEEYWFVKYMPALNWEKEDLEPFCMDKEPLQAAYKTLIWLLENKQFNQNNK